MMTPTVFRSLNPYRRAARLHLLTVVNQRTTGSKEQLRGYLQQLHPEEPHSCKKRECPGSYRFFSLQGSLPTLPHHRFIIIRTFSFHYLTRLPGKTSTVSCPYSPFFPEVSVFIPVPGAQAGTHDRCRHKINNRKGG